jgi:predicted HAD superfamily Cof-like phosphohydrolase
MSSFEKVKHFNRLFGVYDPSKFMMENYRELISKDEIDFCLKLINEELKELCEAFEQKKSFEETIGEACDLVYVLYGMSCRLNLDCDEHFKLTHSNKRNGAISDMTPFEVVCEEYQSEGDKSNFFQGEVTAITEKEEIIRNILGQLVKYYNQLVVNATVRNFSGMLWALSDILEQTLKIFCELRVDFELIFDMIHQANMKKLAHDEDEAIKSVEKYKKEGIFDSPSYRKSYDGKYYVVYNISTGKVLKALNWTKLDLKNAIDACRKKCAEGI